MTIAAQVRTQDRGLREVGEVRVFAELDPHLVIRGWLGPDDLVTLQGSVDRSIRVDVHHLAMEARIGPARERQTLGVIHVVCCRRASRCQDGNHHKNRDTPERLHHPLPPSVVPLVSLTQGRGARSLRAQQARSGCGRAPEARRATSPALAGMTSRCRALRTPRPALRRGHPRTTIDPTPSIRSGPARAEDAQIGHRAGDPDRRLEDGPGKVPPRYPTLGRRSEAQQTESEPWATGSSAMLDLCVSDQRQRFGSVGPAWRRSRGFGGSVARRVGSSVAGSMRARRCRALATTTYPATGRATSTVPGFRRLSLPRLHALYVLLVGLWAVVAAGRRR